MMSSSGMTSALKKTAMTPEAAILLINATVLLICYLVVLPRWAGGNLNRIALHDFMATLVALVLAGSLYLGTGTTFDLGPLSLNWFWFALLTYFAMELPLMFWYLNKTSQLRE